MCYNQINFRDAISKPKLLPYLPINRFHLNKEVTGMFQKFDKVVGFLYGAFIVAFAIAMIKGI